MRVIHSSPRPPCIEFPEYPDLFTSVLFPILSNLDFIFKIKGAIISEIILASRNLKTLMSRTFKTEITSTRKTADLNKVLC